MGIVGTLNTAAPVTIPFKNAGRTVMLLGGVGTCDDTRFRRHTIRQRHPHTALGTAAGSRYGIREAGAVRHSEILAEGLVESAHDLSDGGLAVALAECSFGPEESARHWTSIPTCARKCLAFHEAPSRILVSTSANAKRVGAIADKYDIEAPQWGYNREGN